MFAGNNWEPWKHHLGTLDKISSLPSHWFSKSWKWDLKYTTHIAQLFVPSCIILFFFPFFFLFSMPSVSTTHSTKKRLRSTCARNEMRFRPFRVAVATQCCFNWAKVSPRVVERHMLSIFCGRSRSAWSVKATMSGLVLFCSCLCTSKKHSVSPRAVPEQLCR